MERVTTEKHCVKDGQECHTVKSELKDGRSLGDKFEDAKNAYKTGPEDLARVTKQSTHVDGNKVTNEYKSELKDQRDLGDKLTDAKGAFTGKR